MVEIRQSELLVIAGRPGTGKTTFAINMTAILPEWRMLFCSLEMAKEEVERKLIKITGKNKLENLTVCDDTMLIDLVWLENQLKTGKYNLVFIDHLQIFNAPIKTLTRELKKLCLKYNVCIVALSQLNRKAAIAEPEPWMLRDSGTIEQDADQIWFIKEHSLKIAKNRRGTCGEVGLEHDFVAGRFWFDEDKRERMINRAYEIYKRAIEDRKYRRSYQWEDDLEEILKFDRTMWFNTMELIGHAWKRKILTGRNNVFSEIEFRTFI